MYLFNSSAQIWQPIANQMGGSGGVITTLGTQPPTTPSDGDIWISTFPHINNIPVDSVFKFNALANEWQLESFYNNANQVFGSKIIWIGASGQSNQNYYYAGSSQAANRYNNVFADYNPRVMVTSDDVSFAWQTSDRMIAAQISMQGALAYAEKYTDHLVFLLFAGQVGVQNISRWSPGAAQDLEFDIALSTFNNPTLDFLVWAQGEGDHVRDPVAFRILTLDWFRRLRSKTNQKKTLKIASLSIYNGADAKLNGQYLEVKNMTRNDYWTDVILADDYDELTDTGDFSGIDSFNYAPHAKIEIGKNRILPVWESLPNRGEESGLDFELFTIEGDNGVTINVWENTDAVNLPSNSGISLTFTAPRIKGIPQHINSPTTTQVISQPDTVFSIVSGQAI